MVKREKCSPLHFLILSLELLSALSLPFILNQSFPILASFLSSAVLSFATLYRPITEGSLHLSMMLLSLWQTQHVCKQKLSLGKSRFRLTIPMA